MLTACRKPRPKSRVPVGGGGAFPNDCAREAVISRRIFNATLAGKSLGSSLSPRGLVPVARGSVCVDLAFQLTEHRPGKTPRGSAHAWNPFFHFVAIGPKETFFCLFVLNTECQFYFQQKDKNMLHDVASSK